ncbi:MAG: hypothetical protein RL059_998, partial [Bacteroidota bacterium]
NLEQSLDADQFINGGQVAVDLKHLKKTPTQSAQTLRAQS